MQSDGTPEYHKDEPMHDNDYFNSEIIETYVVLTCSMVDERLTNLTNM